MAKDEIKWRIKEMKNYFHQDFNILGFVKYVEHYIFIINNQISKISSKSIPSLSSLINIDSSTLKTNSLSEIIYLDDILYSFDMLTNRIVSCENIQLLVLYSYLINIILINFSEFERIFKCSINEEQNQYGKGSFEEFEYHQEVMSQLKIGLWNSIIHILKFFYELENFGDMKLMYISINLYKSNHGQRDAHFKEVENYILQFAFLFSNQSKSYVK